MDSWTCLMVEKGPGLITDEMRTTLKAAACNLHLQRLDRLPVKSGVCDGVIQTEWKTYMVGPSGGVLFRAQVFADTGDYSVNFLLGQKDLEAGAAMLREIEEGSPGAWNMGEGTLPVPELYWFQNLRKSALN